MWARSRFESEWNYFMINLPENTKPRGELAEIIIKCALAKKGEVILEPMGDNQRYDLVVDRNGKFERIQCKLGWIRDGVLCFNSSSVYVNSSSIRKKSYHGEIDSFCVLEPISENIYRIPISACTKAGGRESFRIIPAANNNRKRIKMASDYLL